MPQGWCSPAGASCRLSGRDIRRRASPRVFAVVALGSCCVLPAVNGFIHGTHFVERTSTLHMPTKASSPTMEHMSWKRRRAGMSPLMGRNDDWEQGAGEGVGWEVPGEEFMTARIRYLREMERLGQELIELSRAYNAATEESGIDPADAAQQLQQAAQQPPPSPASAQMKELAAQEEMRRMEVMVAERCEQNWRDAPVFSKPIGFVPKSRKVQQVKLSNKRVMYGSDSGYVGLANTVDGKNVFGQQVHTALVTALDYDAESGWMVSAADDGLVVVYRDDGKTVEQRQRLRMHSNRIVSAEILDHRLCMTASVDGKIIVFELDSGKIAQEFWASDTLLAASACKGYVFAGLMSGVVEAFAIRSGRSAFRYISQRCPIRSLTTFPTASTIKIVTGGQDGVIRQFHVRPTQSTDVWKMVSDRTFDDRLVLMCNTHVDQDSASIDQGFMLKGHQGPVVAVVCDEQKVVSASEDGRVTVWDAFKGTPSYVISRHVDGDLVSSLDFNERYLVADGTKGTVYVWDYSVGPPPRRPQGPTKRKRGTSGGSKPKNGLRLGGANGKKDNKRGLPPPPPLPSSLPFPFIGGWNLGHGPTAPFGDMGAFSEGMQPPSEQSPEQQQGGEGEEASE